MKKKLLLVLNDRLSVLALKGELIDRYYNPGNLFDEVHFILLNSDRPDPALLQRTVGAAKLFVHHLIDGRQLFWRTCGWNRHLMKYWGEKAAAIAKTVKPSLIRTHGIFENGYLASFIKRSLQIPFVASLHTHPDADMRRTTPWFPGFHKRLIAELLRKIERITLRSADRLIIVYQSQREYALQNGAHDVRLIYNVVNGSHLLKKTDYQLHDPARIVTVSQQFKEKNPANIIRAMNGLHAELTIIGDGPYHQQLRQLAMQLRLSQEIQFIKSMPNDELCRNLCEYDIFAVHCDSYGVPKAVIEPLLVGLPVIVNRRFPEPVPEMNGDWVKIVPNTAVGYQQGISKLIGNNQDRQALGQRGFEFAMNHFDPSTNEQHIVDLYRELVPQLK